MVTFKIVDHEILAILFGLTQIQIQISNEVFVTMLSKRLWLVHVFSLMWFSL